MKKITLLNLLGLFSKGVFLIIIIVALFEIKALLRETTDINKKIHFLAGGRLIKPDDIEKFHHNPWEMIKYNLKQREHLLAFVWPSTKPQILTKPDSIKETDLLINWFDKSPEPKVIFYHQGINKPGDKARKIVGVQFNERFMALAVQNTALENFADNPDSLMIMANIFKRQLARFKNYPKEEHQERIKESYVAYSKDEMQMLKSFAGAYYVLTIIIHGSKEPDVDLKKIINIKPEDELKGIPSNWILAYSDYFDRHHGLYVIAKNRQYKISFYSLFILVLVLLLYFVRPGLYAIIKKELYQLGITMTWPIVLRLMLTNWHFIFLPFNTHKKRKVIKKTCQSIKNRQVMITIRKRANKLWQKLKVCKTGKEYYLLKSSFRIACGSTKKPANLPERQQALLKLFDAWQEIKKFQEQPITDKDIQTPVTLPLPKIEALPSPKEIALARVNELLPKADDIELENLSVSELERLTWVLIVLTDIHPRALTVFLSQPNFKNALVKQSVFWQAVLTGDRLIIQSQLNLLKEGKAEKALNPADYPNLLSGLKVVIIGGGQLLSKKKQLELALKQLGAESSELIDPFESFGKAESTIQTASKQTLFLRFTPATKHDIRNLLIAHKRIYLEFNRLDSYLFQKEIIEKFLRKKTQQNFS